MISRFDLTGNHFIAERAACGMGASRGTKTTKPFLQAIPRKQHEEATKLVYGHEEIPTPSNTITAV